MNHLKTYENITDRQEIDKIEVGDFIILNLKDNYNNINYLARDFINNNIGEIIKIVPYNTDVLYIEYKNIPLKIKGSFYNGVFCFNKNKLLSEADIVSISKNIKDLEFIYVNKKYNL